jgi:hypothetical protein
LLALEKRTRVAGDAFATARVAVEAVRLCWDVRDLPQLNAHVLILAKRRAQLKQVISDVVKEGLAILPQMTAREERAELITTLRTVTDGKIYVEVRARARYTFSRSKGASHVRVPRLTPPIRLLARTSPNLTFLLTHATPSLCVGGARAPDADACAPARGGGEDR